MEWKSHALEGENNKRINNSDQLSSNQTEAIANTSWREPDSKVSIPGYDDVLNAKDWVDNGSQL